MPPLLQRGFGLVFASDRAIPGLAPAGASARCDVRVHLDALPAWLADAPRTRVHHAAGPDSALTVWALGGGRLLLEYADGTRFVLAGRGSEVWAAWADHATLDDTATYLLGPVAAALLRLRGCVPLHASAVLVDGAAIALVGPSGAGKSTLAASFARLGATVLADDVLAAALDGGRIVVHPAYPRLRLWPDSAAMLFGRADALPLLTPNWDKRFLALDEAGFPEGPVPLAAAYLLGRRGGDAPRVRPLSPRAGLMRLIATTCATFLPQAAIREHEFRLLAHLAREVPLREVTPADDAGALPALCRAIEADAARV